MTTKKPVAAFDVESFCLGRIKCHSVETVRSSRGNCLVDGSTALCASVYLHGSPLKLNIMDMLINPGMHCAGDFYTNREALFCFVQNLIIFEHLYIDSPLICFDKQLYDLCLIFKEAIVPIHMLNSERIDVINYLPALSDKNFKELEEITRKYGEIAAHADFCEQLTYKNITDDFYAYDNNRLWFLRDFNQYPKDSLPEWIPSFMQDSSHYGTQALRTAFYAALCRYLDTPYFPHPGRTPIFAEIMSKQCTSAEVILNLFKKHVVDPVIEEQNLSGISPYLTTIDIPLVAEHILFCARRDGKLCDRILEMRNSNHAKAFRRLCCDLDETRRLGKSGLRDLQKALNEMKSVFQKWASDLDEEVRYRTRKISVSFSRDIIGTSSSLKFKDPVLWSKYSALLFLNDLLRCTKLDRMGRKLDIRMFEWELGEFGFGKHLINPT